MAGRLASGALFLALAMGALAVEGFEDPPFQVASSLTPAEAPAGGELTLTVAFKLRPDVHLYKDRITFQWEELIGATEKGVAKPQGKSIPDLKRPGATIEAYERSASIIVTFQATGAAGEKVAVKGTVSYQGCTETMCFPPMKAPIVHEAAIVASAGPAPSAGGGRSLGGVVLRLVGAFGAGVGISLTPCVYPMVPVTVAIIGGRKRRSRRQAVGLTLVYILGIALTYATVGLVVASLGGRAQSFIQSAWLRVPVAGLFGALALGMFGLFDIQAPAALGGLTQRLAARGKGPLGVFLLGIVSGIVVGPCVTPALFGILTYTAATGDKLLGFLLLFAVAWGMGLALILAGFSAGLLPRAGAWMEWVKKLMGFVLLWGAVYFLAPLLGKHVFHLLTAGLLLAGAVFLGCLDRLTPESGGGERAKHFLGLVAVFAAAAFALSGFTGLMHTGWPQAPTRVDAGSGLTSAAESVLAPADAAALDNALRSGQPVLVDFWATWCAECEELDRHTYSDPAVIKALGRFRALKVDFDRNPDLVKRFDVLGLPAVFIFGPDGKERKDLSFVGYKGATDVLKLLEQAK